MSDPKTAQQRIVYSMLKPAARLAARFGIPIRVLGDLLRHAYFEVLDSEMGLSRADIADRFGQSERHIRSLAKRSESDFFAAEREVGLPRDIEGFLSEQPASLEEIRGRFSSWKDAEVETALRSLVGERRIERDDDGRYRMAQQYAVLRSESFPQRIDALNHFLGGVSKSIVQRLLLDNARSAMIKTISFAADEDELVEFLQRFEGQLRAHIAGLDERARFAGKPSRRFTFGLHLSPDATDSD